MLVKIRGGYNTLRSGADRLLWAAQCRDWELKKKQALWNDKVLFQPSQVYLLYLISADEMMMSMHHIIPWGQSQRVQERKTKDRAEYDSKDWQNNLSPNTMVVTLNIKCLNISVKRQTLISTSIERFEFKKVVNVKVKLFTLLIKIV